MCDVRRRGGDADVASVQVGLALVVVVLLLLVVVMPWSLVDAAACPRQCRCSSTAAVVRCSAVSRVPVPVPPSTLVLDLDHNHISLLTNASFGRGLPLRRLRQLSLQARSGQVYFFRFGG